MAAAGLGMQLSLCSTACAESPHMAKYMPRGGAQKSYFAKKQKVRHDIYALLYACGVMIRVLAAEILENSHLDETVTKLVQIWVCARVSGAISRAVQPALSIYVLGIRMDSLSVKSW
jgi:hypothetical protein